MGTQTEMKPPPIKNRGASEIQITADQLLLDAQIHRVMPNRPKGQLIMDEQELSVSKQEKRKEFEDKIRRQRYNLSAWVRYAQWEEAAKEFARARSIFERALEIQYTNKSLWLRYVEMEMRHKFINHARNLWERAIYYLPREDQFWFKYAYMEEVIGEYMKARDVFQRWMQWTPGEKAWMAYIKFEERMGEFENVKKILYRYLEAFPTLNTYLKVAKFQIKNRNRDAARSIYERTLTELGSEALNQQYFLEFARFEIKHRELDRAREIFKFGLREIPKDKCQKLYQEYLNFQKQHGSKQQIDDVILGERRKIYMDQLSLNSLNYDAWINLINLEEATRNIEKTREVYEAAIKQEPPAKEKRYWRRYIYIWYNYAIFEQEVAGDMIRANRVYERVIESIPHKQFTFSKMWIAYAHFHIRCADLDKARKIFGVAIGKCPKQKLFKAYIELEEQLCQVDRVRAIYERYLEKFIEHSVPYIRYATFEKNMEEFERARDILKIGHQMRVEGLPDPDKFIEEQNGQEEKKPEDEKDNQQQGETQMPQNRERSKFEQEESDEQNEEKDYKAVNQQQQMQQGAAQAVDNE